MRKDVVKGFNYEKRLKTPDKNVRYIHMIGYFVYKCNNYPYYLKKKKSQVKTLIRP